VLGLYGALIIDPADEVCIYRVLLLDNVAVAQVECFGAASLAVEIVLQFTPFAEEGTAIAAMDWRRLLGAVGNVHLDRSASLAIEFVVQPASHFAMIAHFHTGANCRFRTEWCRPAVKSIVDRLEIVNFRVRI
jgi:hypothetical protein